MPYMKSPLPRILLLLAASMAPCLFAAGEAKEFTVVNHLTSVMEIVPALDETLDGEDEFAVTMDDGTVVYVDVVATNAAADGRLRLYTMAPNSSRPVEPYEFKGARGKLGKVSRKAYEGGPGRLKSDHEEQARYQKVLEIAPLYQSEDAMHDQIVIASKRLPKREPGAVKDEPSRAHHQLEAPIRLSALLYQAKVEAVAIGELQVRTEEGVRGVKILPTDIQRRTDVQTRIATGNITGDGPAKTGGFFYLPAEVACIDLFQVAARELGARVVEVRAGNDFTSEASGPDLLFLVLTKDGTPPRVATVPRKDQRYWNGPEPVFGLKEVSVLQ